jgi:hypothetical protein
MSVGALFPVSPCPEMGRNNSTPNNKILTGFLTQRFIADAWFLALTNEFWKPCSTASNLEITRCDGESQPSDF